MALSIRRGAFHLRLNIGGARDPAGDVPADGDDEPATVLQVIDPEPFDQPEMTAYPLRGQNCTVVYTDVVGFAGRQRTERDRLAIRLASTIITRMALAPFADACVWADRGDGLLIIVPPDIPTSAVLACLLRILPDELRDHNDRHTPGSRIQLRVAVDVGPVVADGIGVSGEPIILTARMLEAPALKRAIASSAAPVGVIASAFVFNTAVRNGGEMLGAGDYVPVQVRVKETRIPAWFRLADTPGGQQAQQEDRHAAAG